MTVPNTTYRVLIEKLGCSDPENFIGNEGELFYDPNIPSLKLSDGTTAGGIEIAGDGGGTQGVQGVQGIQGSTGLGIQGLEGSQGIQGIQGLEGSQGIQGLDGSGSQGIQGLEGSQGIQGIQGLDGSGSQGSQGIQGIQGLDGSGSQGIQGISGASILNTNNTFTGITTFSGNIVSTEILKVQQVEETYTDYNTAISSGTTVALDCLNGNTFYITSTVSGDWTANFTNFSLSVNCATNITIIIEQGATAYIPNALQIGGVSQTLNWQGGSTPSGNNGKKDAISYTIFYTGSVYHIFAQLVTFG